MAVCVSTRWLDNLFFVHGLIIGLFFTQDRRLYLKKRNAAIVIACFVRGWKVGFIAVLELTGEETELSFPISSRGEVASHHGCQNSESKGI